MVINGIIFDLDGTLIDTFDTQLKSWREAFEKVGSKMETDKFANNFGKSYKDFTFSIDPSLTNFDMNEVIQRNKNLMGERSNEYSLFPESKKILETLKTYPNLQHCRDKPSSDEGREVLSESSKEGRVGGLLIDT